MEPRVLIVSPQVYPEPHSGVGMRGHFQTVHLSEHWPITLATETGIYSVARGRFTQQSTNALPNVPNAVAYARSVLNGRHYLFEKYNCRHWRLPDFDEFTHVIVHYPALLGLLTARSRPRAAVILDTHNNEREYFESVADQTKDLLRRAVIRRQATISEKIIRRARDVIAATISVSESDRNWVTPLCAENARHFVVPNNLFQYKPTSWSGRKSILYVGSLNVTMNVQALTWFTTFVWPELRRVAPEIEFTVAGRDPSTGLVGDLKSKGITVVANAPTLTPLYKDAICSLIPASSGSGAKIKVCESLALGVPVITTPHGLVGQPAAIKDCCIVREDPNGWVHAIRTQADLDRRSTPAWDDQVKAALDSSFFGTSIKQVADYVNAN